MTLPVDLLVELTIDDRPALFGGEARFADRVMLRGSLHRADQDRGHARLAGEVAARAPRAAFIAAQPGQTFVRQRVAFAKQQSDVHLVFLR